MLVELAQCMPTRRQGRSRRPRPQRPPSAAWSPLLLSNLTLWLRGDLGVVGGASPTAWNDQSGAGNNVTKSGAAAIAWSATAGPNSTAALTFAGSGVVPAVMNATTQPITGNQWTMHVVHKISAAPAGNVTPTTIGGTTFAVMGWTAAPLRLFQIDTNAQIGGAYVANTFEFWTWQAASGGTQTLNVNGSSQSLSGNIAAASLNANIQLAAPSAAATPTWTVAEVIVQNGLPTAGDLTNINAYMLARYGL